MGVTGGIAAYKMPNVARMLKKMHCNVHVLMTENATNFITATTFETLTGNKCLIDTFDRNFEFSVEHVALAKQADLFVLAPASANVIGKIAHGIADDMLTTTIMACPCKKLIAPAMNTNMYSNPIVQDNIARLKGFGYEFVEPVVGMLANGDTGNGKMADEETLLAYIRKELAYKKDLAGKKILVTAGPTREAIDPVRYITNYSTGKMGYALARAAMHRGAEVTLVTGPVSLKRPEFVKVVEITTAAELYQAVTAISDEQDVIIKAAAVADYRPAAVSREKVKKTGEQMSIELERTEDTLRALGERKREGQFLCGFSMETEHMLEHSREKLVKKNLDMIVANNVKVDGAGFGTDTNVVTILTADGEYSLPKMSKEEVAHRILDAISKRNEADS